MSEQIEHLTQCISKLEADGSLLRCTLRQGHDSSHENGNWEWWDDTGIKIKSNPPTEMTSLKAIKEKLARTQEYVESCYQILGRLEPKLNGIDIVQDAIRLEAENDRSDIKAKLNGLTEVSSKLVGLLAEDLGEVRNRLSKTNERLDAIAESQGKLLAALNDLCALVNTSNEELCKRIDAIDSGLHETAMRNHLHIIDWMAGTNAVIAAKLYRKTRHKDADGFSEWWDAVGIHEMPKHGEPPAHGAIAKLAWEAATKHKNRASRKLSNVRGGSGGRKKGPRHERPGR